MGTLRDRKNLKEHLNQYKSGLTSPQIAAGMNAARRNATRLAQDAHLMLEHNRFPSAVALAILSIEESGKQRIFRELALVRNEDELRSAWREYRQHTRKNQHWLMVSSALEGARKLQDFRHLFDPDSEHPSLLDQLKQVSLYTDCLGNAHWSIPDDIIGVDPAKMLVEVADVLSHSREVTADEIDLWIFHMQPVYKTTSQAMERALIAWDKAMRTRGLMHQEGPTMEEFVYRGLRLPTRPRAV